jgi:hypothetical protein
MKNKNNSVAYISDKPISKLANIMSRSDKKWITDFPGKSFSFHIRYPPTIIRYIEISNIFF